MVLSVDGVSDFNALHSRKHDDEVQFCAFNVARSGLTCSGRACRLGLEGLVSKHLDRPYQGGRSKHWVKVKNRKHPAMERVIEAFR